MGRTCALHTHAEQHGKDSQKISDEFKAAEKLANSLLYMRADNGGIRHAPQELGTNPEIMNINGMSSRRRIICQHTRFLGLCIR